MFNLAFAFYDTVHFKVITRKVSYEIAMEEKNPSHFGFVCETPFPCATTNRFALETKASAAQNSSSSSNTAQKRDV